MFNGSRNQAAIPRGSAVGKKVATTKYLGRRCSDKAERQTPLIIHRCALTVSAERKMILCVG